MRAAGSVRSATSSWSDATGPSSADILLSHTHWDHIQGLPFFKPLSAPGNRFCIVRRRPGGRGARGDPATADGPDGISRAARARSPRRFRSRRSAKARSRSAGSPSERSAFAIPEPRWAIGWPPPMAGRSSPTSPTTSWATAARYPVGPDWRAPPGAVPRGSRHADPRRDVLGPDHAGALRVGTLDPAPGGRRWRPRPGADD